jgi:RNA polymerase primary sigma factor
MRLSGQNDSLYKIYIREVLSEPRLTSVEEIELALRVRQGDQNARQRLILANLRLVVKIAHSHGGRGLPLLDLISEGNIGLIRAAGQFDPTKGSRFGAFAATCIRNAISQALAEQVRLIRLPESAQRRIATIRLSESKLRQSLGRDPTDFEIAQDARCPINSVLRLRYAGKSPLSLEATLQNGESASLAGLVSTRHDTSALSQLIREENAGMIEEILKTLTGREQLILQHRFGLRDSQERTLEELGGLLGLTHERVRQLERTALKKLRYRLKAKEHLQRLGQIEQGA